MKTQSTTYIRILAHTLRNIPKKTYKKFSSMPAITPDTTEHPLYNKIKSFLALVLLGLNLTIKFFCIVVFWHYSIATQVTRIFLQTFIEGGRTLVFFLTLSFYIKIVRKLLKRREFWFRMFRVLWNIALVLFIGIETYVIIAVS